MQQLELFAESADDRIALASKAEFSDDRRFRYKLWRAWDLNLPTLMFLMLNPSTADETEDDPTIRRCIGFAKRWGYGSLWIGNLWAFRATDPAELKAAWWPVGRQNDEAIRDMATASERIICAWGAHAEEMPGRGPHVVNTVLGSQRNKLYCLDATKSGQPAHPLYLPANKKPIPLFIRLALPPPPIKEGSCSNSP